MMPKSVKRLSDDIMLYLFELEAHSDAAYAASADPKAEA